MPAAANPCYSSVYVVRYEKVLVLMLGLGACGGAKGLLM